MKVDAQLHSFLFLTLGCQRSVPRLSGKVSPLSNESRDLVGPGTSMEDLKNREISCPAWNNFLFVQPVFSLVTTPTPFFSYVPLK